MADPVQIDMVQVEQGLLDTGIPDHLHYSWRKDGILWNTDEHHLTNEQIKGIIRAEDAMEVLARCFPRNIRHNIYWDRTHHHMAMFADRDSIATALYGMPFHETEGVLKSAQRGRELAREAREDPRDAPCQQVFEAELLVNQYLEEGHDTDQLKRSLCRILLREDAELHMFQVLEVAFRHYELTNDPEEKRIHLLAATRYITAQKLMKNILWSTENAERLARGELLSEREDDN